MYWAAGLHVYIPLPFRPGEGGIGDLFKLHTFANIGNIGEFYFSKIFIYLLLCNKMKPSS